MALVGEERLFTAVEQRGLILGCSVFRVTLQEGHAIFSLLQSRTSPHVRASRAAVRLDNFKDGCFVQWF